MPYIKNATKDYIRVGTKSRETGDPIIRLEPAEIVERIDPVTRERTVRQGQNVAAISEEDLSSSQVKRSLGRLFVLISEEEFEARQNVVWGQEREELDFILGPNGERVPIIPTSGEDQSVVIKMDDDDLQGYAGVVSGTRSAPQNTTGE